MALYFIADLHLEEKRPELSRAFFNYLNKLPKDAEALYILGDLFEAWVGDDDDSAFAARACEQLKRLRERPLPVYVMRGNRDFLLGDGFCQKTGCLLIEDPTVIDYHGTAYLLMHGDTLCTEDEDYIAFRRQVRSSKWQQTVLALPLSQRRQLAQQLRDQSLAVNQAKSNEIMDVTADEMQRVMKAHNVRELIHGHTHRPAHHKLLLDNEKANRWVLGDWDQSGWQIRVDNHGAELEVFSLDRQA